MKLPHGTIKIFMVFVLTACSHFRYPLTDHFDGERFFNEDREAAVEKSFFTLIKWQLTRKKSPWPKRIADNLKPDFTPVQSADELSVTYINHATALIQLRGLNILTDPIFSERASPFTWIGPSRARDPGSTIAQLPRIDIVIISHNHYDHLDLASLRELNKKDAPLVIAPLGEKKFLEENGITHVSELDWWQKQTLNSGQNISLVPMQHWSARGLFDRCDTLWGGYVIESESLKIMFAGDTGYGRQFKEIYAKFGAMDVSLLPIGAYEPRWFMKAQHMNPEEAVRAHAEVDSALSIGIHYGTFQLTDEAPDDPVVALGEALRLSRISPAYFIAPKNGQTIHYRQTR